MSRFGEQWTARDIVGGGAVVLYTIVLCYFVMQDGGEFDMISKGTKMYEALPYLWYLAGTICLAVGTIICIVRVWE